MGESHYLHVYYGGGKGKTTSGGSVRASGEHQMTRRGSRTAQWAFAFALRAFLFSRFNARPKRSVTHEQNEGQKSSTVLIGLEFWRILVDLRAAVGCDVLRAASVGVLFADMLHECNEWLRYTLDPTWCDRFKPLQTLFRKPGVAAP